MHAVSLWFKLTFNIPFVTHVVAALAFHLRQVLDIHRKTLICSGSLGITPKAILTWAGFSDIGVLYVMDSEGMVFALVKV